MNRRAFVFLAGSLGLSVPFRAWAEAPTDSSEIRLSRVVDVSFDSDVDRRPVVTAIAVSPDGATLAAAGDDHLVRITALDDGRRLHTLERHDDWVRALAFSPSGESLASAGDDGLIQFWDTATGVAQRGADHPGRVRFAAFSPDGAQLAAAGFSSPIVIYDASSGDPVRSLDQTHQGLCALAYSPDGARLATTGRDGSLRLWDVSSGETASEIATGEGRWRSLAFSPSGDTIIAVGDGTAIRGWNTSDGSELVTLPGRPGKSIVAVFCSDDRLAVAASDNQIRVWNLSSQHLESRLIGHTGSVAALSWNAAQAVLISGSFDTSVRCWNLDAAPQTTASEQAAPNAQRR